MPNPVEALPCGSRSMTRTRLPMAASAVPRLMAVVVLPTPPFWLAMASTRQAAAEGGSADAGKTVHLQDAALGVAAAGKRLTLKTPMLPCGGDLIGGAAALEEQTRGAPREAG